MYLHYILYCHCADFEGVQLKTFSFPLKQLKAATNNFVSTHKIGEGGFDPVYKAFQLITAAGYYSI